jgi:hypothetical protein
MTTCKICNKFYFLHWKASVLLTALILLIALSACSQQRVNSAGKINGIYIDQQDFLNSLRGHFTGFVLEKDRTPSDAEKQEIYQKTWQDIVKHVVLKEYFDKYQIQVSEQEVIDTLINNIPASMLSAPVFQTNGNFNKNLYIAALTSEQDKQLDWLKKHYYDYYIPIAKLKLELQNKEIISNKELSSLYKLLNTEADIDWIIFEPSLTEVRVAQAEVERYYQTHQNDYKIKRYAELGWVEIPVQLSEEDIDASKATIDSIYFELTNGKPFAAMVEQLSQAASARNGGALGFVKNEDLSSRLRSALEGMDKGSYTRPLKIDNYWVIYQVVERTRNLVKLNELAREIVPGENNLNKVKDTAVHLRDLALQMGLPTAAQEMDLTYKRSGVVDKDSLWLADGDACAYLIDRAYTQKQGAILEPVYSKVLQAWLLAEVVQVQPLMTKTLVAVSDELSAILTAEKQTVTTLATARAWAAQNKSGQLSKAAAEGLPMISTPRLNVNGKVKAESVRSIFMELIRAANAKKGQVPYLIDNEILLPVVSGVREINPPLIEASGIRQYYFQNLKPDWFDQWLATQVKNADLKIWYSYP